MCPELPVWTWDPAGGYGQGRAPPEHVTAGRGCSVGKRRAPVVPWAARRRLFCFTRIFELEALDSLQKKCYKKTRPRSPVRLWRCAMNEVAVGVCVVMEAAMCGQMIRPPYPESTK